MRITKLGEEILRQKCEPVLPEEINDELRAVISEMFETMISANGVGLAAPQAGIAKRFFVLMSDDDVRRVFINPEIIKTSAETGTYEEGCLSIPGESENIVRPVKVSVTALDELRSRFPRLPIIGTVPAIRLASRVTKNKRIGLLATNATVSNPYNERLKKDFASDCQVFSRGDPDLINFIEHSLFNATKEERLSAVKPAIEFFRANDCDTIILGCTHFTHIASDIKEAAGDDVMVVDSREGVVNQAIKVEDSISQDTFSKDDAEEGLNQRLLPDDCTFFCTGYKNQKDEEEYRTLCSNFNIPWGGVVALE